MGKTNTDRHRAQRHRTKADLLHFRVLDPAGVTWHGQTVPQGELVTVRHRSSQVHVSRWVATGRLQREFHPIGGMCAKCQCTWTRACAGGCMWTSREKVLCTKCQAGRRAGLTMEACA